MRGAVLALAIALARADDCAWTRETGLRCGYPSFLSGSDDVCENAYIGGVSGDSAQDVVTDVRDCLATCAGSEECAGVDFIEPGTGGSGGDGITSDTHGRCFYRKSTACGRACGLPGRSCYTAAASVTAAACAGDAAANWEAAKSAAECSESCPCSDDERVDDSAALLLGLGLGLGIPCLLLGCFAMRVRTRESRDARKLPPPPSAPDPIEGGAIEHLDAARATGRVVGDVEAAAIPAVAVKATAVSAPGPSVPGATRAHVVDAEVVGGEPTVASAAPIVSGHVVAAAPRS